MGMSADKWDAAQALFEGALKREPPERAAYLEQACPADPELRTDVLTMVALSESDREFLETPVLMQLLNAPLLAEGELVAERFRVVSNPLTDGSPRGSRPKAGMNPSPSRNRPPANRRGL